MRLCPNCKQPFEEKAGRFFCPEHGWHGVNEQGEIVPADPPTAAELAEFEKKPQNQPADEKNALQDGSESTNAAGSDTNYPPGDDPAEPVCLSYSDTAACTLLIVAGIIAAVFVGYAWYKKRKQQQGAAA